MRTRLQFGRKTGATLIEVAISAGLLGTIFGVAAMVGAQGQGAYESTAAEGDLDTQLRRVTERIVNELTGVSAAMMFPDPDADGTAQVSFQTPSGFVGGNVVWGPTTQFSLQYDTGEVDDGLDNDGDGLVDECALLLTRNVGANQVSTVLCDSVCEFLEGEVLNANDDNGNDMDDEPGFCLQRVGDVLTIRMSLASVDGEGDEVVRTVETSMQLR